MFVGASAVGAQTISSCDLPNVALTLPVGINAAGEIAGYTLINSSLKHGFLRDADGQFVVFDPPGSISTEPEAINESGDIAGSFFDGQSARGFVRSWSGVFTVIDTPPGFLTDAHAINSHGDVVGDLIDLSSFTSHGFIYSQGTMQVIDVPGAISTSLLDINARGEAVGTARMQDATLAFSVSNQGEIQMIDIPDAYGVFWVQLNNRGEIAGSAHFVPSPLPLNPKRSFLRYTDGTVVQIDYPGIGTNQAYLNDPGEVAGGGGVIRDVQGNLSAFDAGGISGTTLVKGINNGGDIIGTFLDDGRQPHCFVRSAH
jgi:hypothetical protein